MDFDAALKAHSKWKMKLSFYLSRPDGSLSADEIARDDRCDLGQWLHGEGAKYKYLPAFAKLQVDHARFHRAAAQVVEKADADQNVTAEIAMGASSPYAQASTAITLALMSIKKAI